MTVAFPFAPRTAFMANASRQMCASVSQDMEARYAISSVQPENGASLARRTVCAKTEPVATPLTANASVPEDTQASIATRRVLRTIMDRTAERSVAADMVEAAITFLASVIAPLATRDLSAMIFARLESTEMNASQSASVRMVVRATLRLANATALLDGLARSVRIVVRKVFGARIALRLATVTTEPDAITLLASASANLVTTTKSV